MVVPKHHRGGYNRKEDAQMATILGRTKKYVKKLANAGRLSAGLCALTVQTVAGILQSKSVHLSEIGRSLNESVPLIDTERRLSKEMANKDYDDEELRHAYLKIASRAIQKCPYIIGDTTDLSKPYGKAFEYLDQVRDASSKDKHIEPGYWAILLEGTTRDHKNVPINLEVFSTKDPEYMGWYETIKSAFVRVMSSIPQGADWLLDRGFDDIKIMELLNVNGRFWTIRQRQDRNVVVAWMRWNMAELAQSLLTPHRAWVPYVDKRTHEPMEWQVQFNAIPVELPGIEGTYTLIVVDTGRKERVVLLSNRRSRDPRSVARLIRAYMRRWGVEEGIRLLKQKTSLEDFRVRRWTSIRRLALMAMLAYGFAALMVHYAPKMAERIINNVKVFIPVVMFPYYRLLDGIAAELASRS
jgi:hypothetical protein